MNPNEKVLDVLRYAYLQEVKAELFYSRLADRAARASVARKLRELARTEKHHQQLVAQWYESATGKVLVLGVSGAAPEGGLRPLREPMTLDEVMDMAVESERRAEVFYRRWREKAKTEEERDILELMADEEQAHALVLSQDKAAMAEQLIAVYDMQFPWDESPA